MKGEAPGRGSNRNNSRSSKEKKEASDRRSIFVTVGTTSFDGLVDAVTSEPALRWMADNGYDRLAVQYGKGRKPSAAATSFDGPLSVAVESYDYKPSLEGDMSDADLIISHAGAGTVMECLRMRNGKRLAVVINSSLMDNHQTELADALGRRRHLYVVRSPDDLMFRRPTTSGSETTTSTVWDELEAFRPVPKEPGDEGDFTRLLNGFLGLDDDDCNPGSSSRNHKKES